MRKIKHIILEAWNATFKHLLQEKEGHIIDMLYCTVDLLTLAMLVTKH